MDILLTLDRTEPLRAQLERELRDAIRAGRLRAGSRLPPSRLLAEELEISRGVVVEAYSQLVAEGYLVARAGDGTRIAGGLAQQPPAAPASSAAAAKDSLRPAQRHPGSGLLPASRMAVGPIERAARAARHLLSVRVATRAAPATSRAEQLSRTGPGRRRRARPRVHHRGRHARDGAPVADARGARDQTGCRRRSGLGSDSRRRWLRPVSNRCRSASIATASTSTNSSAPMSMRSSSPRRTSTRPAPSSRPSAEPG